jgi:hypothetical protein
MTIPTVTRQWKLLLLLLLTVLVVGAASSAAAASASTPEHLKQTVVAPAVEVPAGTVCDFGFHQEASYTQNLTRFFDGEGSLVRVEDHVDITVRRRNLDTGYTLVEEDHYAAYVESEAASPGPPARAGPCGTRVAAWCCPVPACSAATSRPGR